MFTLFSSEHLWLVAISGGMISAGMNTVLEDLINALIDRENLEIRTTLLKSAIATCTVGLLIGIIYYAFARYGFPESSLTPMRLIFWFTIWFGLGNPLLSATIKLVNRLWTKNV